MRFAIREIASQEKRRRWRWIDGDCVVSQNPIGPDARHGCAAQAWQLAAPCAAGEDRPIRRNRRLWLACLSVALTGFAGMAEATWKLEYANAPKAVRTWYENAQLTEAAQKRFGFKSCCAHADVVKTKFRVSRTDHADQWYWLNHGRWDLIPSDIIHWGENAPDGQPTLFAIGDVPTCFYPGAGGL